MNDNPTWQVARLDRHRAARQRISRCASTSGSTAFGINAYTPSENGTLINEHDESGSGQEELYIVLDRQTRPSSRRRDRRRARRDIRVRPAGDAAEGDRGRNRPRCRLHTRRGVPGDRLG